MKRCLCFVPTLLVAASVLYLSLLREPHLMLNDMVRLPWSDKIAHALMYFTLTAVYIFDLRRLSRNIQMPKPKYTNAVVVGAVAIIAYGGLIELLQGAFFAPRTAEWLDWLADTIGTLTATALMTARNTNT